MKTKGVCRQKEDFGLEVLGLKIRLLTNKIQDTASTVSIRLIDIENHYGMVLNINKEFAY
jgi:hypothetical protein